MNWNGDFMILSKSFGKMNQGKQSVEDTMMGSLDGDVSHIDRCMHQGVYNKHPH